MATFIRETENNYGRISDADRENSPIQLKLRKAHRNNTTVESPKKSSAQKRSLSRSQEERPVSARRVSPAKPVSKEVKSRPTSSEKRLKGKSPKPTKTAVTQPDNNANLFTIKETQCPQGEDTMKVQNLNISSNASDLKKPAKSTKSRPMSAWTSNKDKNNPEVKLRQIQLKPQNEISVTFIEKPKKSPVIKPRASIQPKPQEVKAIDIRASGKDQLPISPTVPRKKSPLAKSRSSSVQRSRPTSASDDKKPKLKAHLLLKYKSKELSEPEFDSKVSNNNVTGQGTPKTPWNFSTNNRGKTPSTEHITNKSPPLARVLSSAITSSAAIPAHTKPVDFQIKHLRISNSKYLGQDKAPSRASIHPSTNVSTPIPSVSDQNKKRTDSNASLSRPSPMIWKSASNSKDTFPVTEFEYGLPPQGMVKYDAPRKYSLEYNLLNLLHGLYCKSKLQFPSNPVASINIKYNVCEGNNGRLVEGMIRNKGGVMFDTNYNRCNVQWSQTYHRLLISTSLRFCPRIAYKDIAREDFNGLNLLDSDAVATQIADLQLFKVSSPKIIKEIIQAQIKSDKLAYVIAESLNIINHIRGITCIGHKTRLTETIIKYAKNRRVDPFTIIPRTYLVRLQSFDVDMERIVSYKKKADGFTQPLIVKPGENTNRGQGILMTYTQEELVQATLQILRGKKAVNTAIVQWYITNPLLYQRRKFDIRCYGLVVRLSGRTLYYWYQDGYARTSSFEFNCNKGNLMVHLTNEAVQVKDKSNFGAYEPGNKVYFDQLSQYFDSTPEFTSRKATWDSHIVPEFKV